MSRRMENFEFFCTVYFSDYLPSIGIEVLNHNSTSHGSLEGVSTYYIATILEQGQELKVTINLTEFNNTTSMQDMLDLLNRHTFNCIFMNLMDTHDTKEIEDFFHMRYFK